MFGLRITEPVEARRFPAHTVSMVTAGEDVTSVRGSSGVGLVQTRLCH